MYAYFTLSLAFPFRIINLIRHESCFLIKDIISITLSVSVLHNHIHLLLAKHSAYPLPAFIMAVEVFFYLIRFPSAGIRCSSAMYNVHCNTIQVCGVGLDLIKLVYWQSQANWSNVRIYAMGFRSTGKICVPQPSQPHMNADVVVVVTLGSYTHMSVK